MRTQFVPKRLALNGRTTFSSLQSPMGTIASKSRAIAWLLALCVTWGAALQATGDDKMLVLNGSRFVKSVYDLGCTRVTTSTSSHSDETAASNRQKINTWFATLDGARPATLVVPYGWVAVDQALTPPNNCAIICAGGWAFGRYNALYYMNHGAAGFMRVGNSTDAMIELGGYGNVLRVNLLGYRYVSQSPDALPTTGRCPVGIRLARPDGVPVCGRHEISANITGCTIAILLDDEPTEGHCDNSLFTKLEILDCPTMVKAENEQAVGHTFTHVKFFAPAGLQSVVFDAPSVGRWLISHLSISGEGGVTIVKTPNEHLANSGSFVFSFVDVDRTITANHTQIDDDIDLILADIPVASGLFLRMTGKISWGGPPSPNFAVPWYNASGQSAIKVTGSTSGHNIKIDVDGLDTATKEAWD